MPAKVNFILECFKWKFLYLGLGNIAQTKFRSLRKKYTAAKKRYEEVYVSGTGSAKVLNAKKKLDKLNFLKWLDGHISQRTTKNNIEDDQESTTEDEESEGEADDVEMDENLSPTQLTPIDEDIYQLEETTPSCPKSTPNETTPDLEINEMRQNLKRNLAPEKSETKPKVIKSRARMNKKERFDMTRTAEKEERVLMERLVKSVEKTSEPAAAAAAAVERDECSVFGELIAMKLRKLPEDSREQAQCAINSVLLHFRPGSHQSVQQAYLPYQASQYQQYVPQHHASQPYYMQQSSATKSTAPPYIDLDS